MKLLAALLLTCLAAHGAAADDAAPLYACHAAPASAKMHASFRPEVSLQDLSTWVVGFSCKNLVFAPGVARNATRLTVIAPAELSPKQALQLYVDAVEAAGFVVAIKNDTITVKLGPGMPPQGCPDVAVGNPTQDPWQPPPLPVATPDPLEVELDQNIRAVDATHDQVTAQIVDRLLADPVALGKGARVVPAVENGKPAGFKLYAIRSSSIYAHLGLQNGDTVRAINGSQIDSADQALEAYTKLRSASSIQVDLVRRGKPMSISISIVKSPADILRK